MQDVQWTTTIELWQQDPHESKETSAPSYPGIRERAVQLKYRPVVVLRSSAQPTESRRSGNDPRNSKESGMQICKGQFCSAMPLQSRNKLKQRIARSELEIHYGLTD